VDSLGDPVREQRADRPDAPCVLERVADLAEDLVLAEHHRLQPCSDTQQVPEALFVVHLHDDRLWDVPDQHREGAPAGFEVLGDDVPLDAVARLEDERLLDTGLVEQCRGRGPLARRVGQFQLLD